MTVTLDTGYDEDTTETKIDFAPTPNAFRFGGREVEREIKLNSTDEKTGWVTRKTMSQSVDVGGKIRIEAKWGDDRGIEFSAVIMGQMKDNTGIKINAGFEQNFDGKGDAFLEADASKHFDLEFDLKTSRERD